MQVWILRELFYAWCDEYGYPPLNGLHDYNAPFEFIRNGLYRGMAVLSQNIEVEKNGELVIDAIPLIIPLQFISLTPYDNQHFG